MPGGMLTEEQLEHVATQGFLRIGALLDDELIGSLRDEYDRVFAEARATDRYRDLAEPDDDDEMLQIMQMCERSLPFRSLLYHDAILDIVQDLIGPTIQLFHDQALFKPAHTGGPIHWHQDNGYWHCEPADLVSCWLTLDDVDAANGAMHVLPGSHREAVEHPRAGTLLDAGGHGRYFRCRGRGVAGGRRDVPSLPDLPLHAPQPYGPAAARIRHALHASRNPVASRRRDAGELRSAAAAAGSRTTMR